MAAGDVQPPPRILVIGDRESSFVQATARLADRYGLAVTSCDDVYAGVAALAAAPGRFLAVAGLFRHLATGKGDFFTLASRRSVPCCCLFDARSAADRRKLPAAVRRGVHIVGDPAEIREFLEDRLADAGCNASGGEDLSAEDGRATEAEIEALLGQETDE
jgi:alkanesulfonate monooxygenase SsuD/methylene tetrahydromethanopterin reductase-like flavin-dependent oxidoreductase (luciferase family)